jgi:hypothetical protein
LTLLLAVCTAVLCAALVLLVRENGRLRDRLVALTASRARERGLEEGRVLDAITLRNAAGEDVGVRFGAGEPGSLLLFHASACDACEATRPLWRNMVERSHRPDVRVLCIQTDVTAGAPIELEGLPASLAVPLPPTGWPASLPAVPATLLVDGAGVLTRAWYGELSDDMTREATEAIGALGRGER